MALYFEYRINTSAHLKTVLWRFCPLG